MSALAICAASLETFATEIRALQKTEVREVEEPFGERQKGSSAMPHKRNPVGCEQVTGLARLVRANALAALENVALWHERDISHSSVERVILPDSFLALDHMLRRMTEHRARDGRAHRPHEAEPGARPGASSSPGQLLLELTARGMAREDAYRVVQHHAMEAWKHEGDFRQRVAADPAVRQGPQRRASWTRCSAWSATSATWTPSSPGSSGQRPRRPPASVSPAAVDASVFGSLVVLALSYAAAVLISGSSAASCRGEGARHRGCAPSSWPPWSGR